MTATGPHLFQLNLNVFQTLRRLLRQLLLLLLQLQLCDHYFCAVSVVLVVVVVVAAVAVVVGSRRIKVAEAAVRVSNVRYEIVSVHLRQCGSATSIFFAYCIYLLFHALY